MLRNPLTVKLRCYFQAMDGRGPARRRKSRCKSFEHSHSMYLLTYSQQLHYWCKHHHGGSHSSQHHINQFWVRTILFLFTSQIDMKCIYTQDWMIVTCQNGGTYLGLPSLHLMHWSLKHSCAPCFTDYCYQWPKQLSRRFISCKHSRYHPSRLSQW
jgi:hypothetical protein